MARAIRCVLIVASLGVAAACRAAAPDQTVERMDVALTVLTDGSIEVEERLVVRFGATPSSEFHRYTPVWRHDGVFGIDAQMDGATFAPGDGAGRLQVRPGGALDVRWSFAPVSSATHLFLLRYRAANAVEISGIRGTVSWRVLPAGRGFDAQSVRVSLSLPPGAVLLQDPWVEEAGWTVQREPAGLTAARTGVSRDESATAGVEFTDRRDGGRSTRVAVSPRPRPGVRARVRLRRTVSADRRRGRAGHDACEVLAAPHAWSCGCRRQRRRRCASW